MRTIAVLIMLMTGAVLYFSSCEHKPNYTVEPTDSVGGFPDKIGKIFIEKCATAGCHNAQSYQNSAGLRLDGWEQLFDGGNSGAVIVPYNSENSSLLFYINPDSSLGLKAQPQMPLNAPPLTVDEYKTIKEWVDAGAPDRNGNIPFASNPDTRQKIYVTNQGCDMVGVIDAEKRVIMRYIKVGKTNNYEVPHYIKTGSDGYAYVSFIAGTVFQKIDMKTDKVVGELEVGFGSWNAFHISDDGKKILLGDYFGGNMLLIDAERMQLIQGLVNLRYPHGIISNTGFDSFYITSQLSNMVYKLSINDIFDVTNLEQISIDNNPPSQSPVVRRNPHEIVYSPDRSKYFLTCEVSHEVRVMDVKTDRVIDSIPVGIFPQTMAMSRKKPYLFVTCTEDNSLLSGFRGSVYVINYNTHKVVKRIDGQFYQPHGISVDDRNGLVYIANRNVLGLGVAPHHASTCGGKNGYYIVYDLNTLEKLPKRYEMSVDPYSSDVRFHE